MKANLISLTAAVMLLLAFALTAGFTIWNSQRDRHFTEVYQSEQRVSQLYETASALAKQTELLTLLWIATGQEDYRSQLFNSVAEFTQTLEMIQHSGRPEDEDFAIWAQQYFGDVGEPFLQLESNDGEAVAEAMRKYREAYVGLYQSLNNGPFPQPRLLAALTDPSSTTDPYALANPASAIMLVEAADRAARARKAMSDNESAEALFVRVTPVLYIADALITVMLLFTALHFSRRAARTLSENRQLKLLSTTDVLTQIGNRRGFEEALKRHTSSSDGPATALVMLDLDDFKMVNDTFGHARGDSVLATFARKLKDMSLPDAEHFRVGGDEFAVLLPGIDARAARQLADRVRLAVAGRIAPGITVSAGVSDTELAANDELLLRQQADAALYEAKLRGRNLSISYERCTGTAPVFPAARLQAVRRLLEEGRISPVFQPIWDLGTSAVFGYEGLSRPHPDYELAGPEQAFEIAEKFGRASELDRLCRGHLLAAAVGLPADVRVFINLSPYSLADQSFSAERLLSEISDAGLAVDRVVFEITEKSSVPAAVIAERVKELRDSGVQVALDDVGAGNNGLEILRTVAVDFVKIDHSIISAAATSVAGRAALMALLAFSSECGASVVAEGIEDEATFELVRRLSANTALKGTPGLIHGVQGYLLGLPEPVSVGMSALHRASAA
ncbi:MAG: EAL domain-containing protein [Dehalococcoidia bacterium]